MTIIIAAIPITALLLVGYAIKKNADLKLQLKRIALREKEIELEIAQLEHAHQLLDMPPPTQSDIQLTHKE